MNVIWRPQPKQAEFQRRGEYEALYGGAAGGGKSDALLIEALRQVQIPWYRGVIIRKTFPQLSDLIERSRELYGAAYPKAVYNATEHRWRFPSGALICFGSMQHPQDRIQYQGKRYDFVAFDELTHFTWEEYSYLFSRNRPGGPGTRVYIRASANPGGIGHAWVKERFISAAPPLTTIWERVEIRTPTGKKKMQRSRVFVPATVFDNQKLLDNDPGYLQNLAMMSDDDRDALLYGSWDSFDGQVFKQWRNDPAHYADRKWTHVVAPFEVPAHWRIWRGFDFGYARPYSVGWYAADSEGRIYRIRELYGCTGRPNEGVKQNPHEIAAQIRQIEQEDENLRGREIIGVADPSIFDESRGQSVAAMMADAPNFILWHGGDNHRLPGKMQFHNRLAFDGDGRPMFQVFSTCRNFIRTLPSLCYSERNVEDIDTDMEDHIYDECRYVLMDNPISPRASEKPPEPQADPLDQREPEKPQYFVRL